MRKYSPDELLKNDLIDSATYEKIVEYEKETSGVKQNKSTNLFLNILAGIFIAFGVIWIVAANWSIIPSYAKLSAAFLLIIFTMIYIIKLKKKEKNLEAISIVYAALCICTIALIGQIFNVAANTLLFLLVSILIIGFIPIYTKSYLLEALYMFFSTIYIFVNEEIFEAFDMPLLNILENDKAFSMILSIIVLSILPLLFFAINNKELKRLEDNKKENEKDNENKNKKDNIRDLKIIKIKKTNKFFKKLSFIIAFILCERFAFVSGIEEASFALMLPYIFMVVTNKYKLFEQSEIYKCIIYIGLYIFAIFDRIEIESLNNLPLFIITCILIIYCFIVLIKEYKGNNKKLKDIAKDNDKVNDKDKDNDALYLSKSCDMLNQIILLSSSIIYLSGVILASVVEAINNSHCYLSFMYLYLLFLSFYSIFLMLNGTRKSRMKDFKTGEILFAAVCIRLIFVATNYLMIRGVFCIVIAFVIKAINKKMTSKIENKENKKEIDKTNIKEDK